MSAPRHTRAPHSKSISMEAMHSMQSKVLHHRVRLCLQSMTLYYRVRLCTTDHDCVERSTIVESAPPWTTKYESASQNTILHCMYDFVKQSQTLHCSLRRRTAKHDLVLHSATLFHRVRLPIAECGFVLQSTLFGIQSATLYNRHRLCTAENNFALESTILYQYYRV